MRARGQPHCSTRQRTKEESGILSPTRGSPGLRVQVSSSLKDCGDWPGEETGQETRRNCHFGPPGARVNNS